MMADRIVAECMNNEVYVNSWINCLIIVPPLIVKKEELDQGITAIDRALTLADKELSRTTIRSRNLNNIGSQPGR